MAKCWHRAESHSVGVGGRLKRLTASKSIAAGYSVFTCRAQSLRNLKMSDKAVTYDSPGSWKKRVRRFVEYQQLG